MRVMVAQHNAGVMRLHPADDIHWIGAKVHQITAALDLVPCFCLLDSAQRVDIGVNI